MNRLAFVKTKLGALGASALPSYDRIDRIVSIRADPDRLIRITVCTRPFRAAGPRLDVEQLGTKTVFHQCQSYLGLPGTPVEWNDRYVFSNLTRDELAANDERGNTHGFADYNERIGDLYPARRELELRDGEKPYKVKTARRKSGMTFNIAGYSRQLVEEFKSGGGTIEPREFATPSDVATVTQRLIVNCTGYGARKLWSDESLVPVRGQIGWLPPQEGVDCGTALDNLIITGRRNGIAVQPTPQGDDTGWNDDGETPDRDAAKAGVFQLARFYETAST